MLFALATIPCAAQKAVGTSAATAPDPPPTANPARPTITNPATLPPVGYLQFEQGYLGSIGSTGTASQYGINQVTKIAVLQRLMLVAGGQPFAHSTLQGDTSATNAAGAVQVGFQAVFYAPSTPPGAVTSPSKSAAQPAAQPPAVTAAQPAPQPDAAKSIIPTAAAGFYHTVYAGNTPDIDLGSATNTFLFLFSGDAGKFHYDTNYILNEQDGSGGDGLRSVRRAQYAQTLSVNHSFYLPNVQLGVELYHFTQPSIHATADGSVIPRANLVGLLITPSYQPRPNIVIDLGFERSLTSTSTHWQSFAGFTYLLPHRLWPSHSGKG